MFISAKQLQNIIETNKQQAQHIQYLTTQVEALQHTVKELTEVRKLLTDDEVEALTEQLVNNDEFQYSLSEWINIYLGDNIDDYVSSYIDNHHYIITDLVDDKINEIFEEVTIKIER
tara:strand:+ start:7131 stop:7481 length:351 start_codon:yes stop_codon:yes gene_type:complete